MLIDLILRLAGAQWEQPAVPGLGVFLYMFDKKLARGDVPEAFRLFFGFFSAKQSLFRPRDTLHSLGYKCWV